MGIPLVGAVVNFCKSDNTNVQNPTFNQALKKNNERLQSHNIWIMACLLIKDIGKWRGRDGVE